MVSQENGGKKEKEKRKRNNAYYIHVLLCHVML